MASHTESEVNDDNILSSWTELGASAKGNPGAKPNELEAAQSQKTQETLSGLVEQMGTLRAMVEQSAWNTAASIETMDKKLQAALDKKAADSVAQQLQIELIATEANFLFCIF